MTSTISAVLSNTPEMIDIIFESMPEPTFLLDKSGTYVQAWGGSDKKRHHDPSSLVGLNQYQVLPADKAIWFSQIIVDVIESQKPYELEYSLHPQQLPTFEGLDGPKELQHFSALVIPLPKTQYVLWTVRNITEYKHTLEKLAHHQLELERLTNLDHLTQLYNRYALDVLLPDAIQLAKTMVVGSAILMIDVDCFKQYNDNYGHLKGDKVLQAIGDTIRTWASPRDLCFRYGGDEFLIYIADIDEERCVEKAQQLKQMIDALSIANRASTVNDCVSVTIGVHHHPYLEEDLTVEQFVGIADRALYYAKERQRGSIHLFEEFSLSIEKLDKK